MLTKMTDADWITVLRVFEIVRSRRGDKGRDDRKFLSALHHFSVHNITWRALPAEFGGRLYSADQSYQSNGAVGANGVVRVSVAGAGRSATGSGRLSHNSGAGRWWSSRGECSGSWSASRRASYY
jgi:hypothetical protein